MLGAALIAAALAAAGLGCWLAVTGDNPITRSAGVDTPRGLDVSQVSATGAVLSWDADERATSYVVTVASNPTFTRDVRTMTSRRATVSVTDLAASTSGEHYFRVRAVGSDDAAMSRAQRFALRPGATKGLTVTKASTSGVAVRLTRARNTSAFDVLIFRDQSLTRRVAAVRTTDASQRFVAGGLSPQKRYWIRYRPVNATHRGELSKAVAFTTRPSATTFRLATWNVCSESCSNYAGRAPAGAQLFNDSKVDIFALQESGGERVGAVTNQIWSGGAQRFVRATGGMKTRYIFYRPALFEQLGGGSFVISDNKWATWAHMKLRSTGREFFVVNIHLKNARKNDARRGLEMQRALAGMAQLNPRKLPIVYAGDFNSGLHREQDSPGRVIRAAGLIDTVTVAAKVVNGRVNTIHDVGPAIPASGVQIDHIYTDGQFAVLEWNQLIRASGGRYVKPYVSDHNALSAVLGLDTMKVDLGAVTRTTRIPRPTPSSSRPSASPTPAKATP
ncbi:MAG: hypothetical protein JWP31_2337 [Aeromicrobium sp.]|nr:hypothetical protein [Aeromicrobium sp.]